MTRSRIVAMYVLSLALFTLAGALVYFTIAVSTVSQELPGIMESISHVSDKVESVIKEFDKVRDLVPPILHEAEQIRKQIPPILKETAAIREQVPSVVESIDKASAAVEMASNEVEKSRPVVTELTTQIKNTTQAIPPMLDHAEQIVNSAEGIGNKAGMKVTTGVITGVVTSPFAVMGNIGKNLTGHSDKVARKYNDTDYKLIEDTVLKLAHSSDIGTSLDWNNPDSSNHGTVTLKAVHDSDRRKCRTLIVKSMTGGKTLEKNEITACREDGGKWYITK
jgi:surface antigen/archaellum component FlaC